MNEIFHCYEIFHCLNVKLLKMVFKCLWHGSVLWYMIVSWNSLWYFLWLPISINYFLCARNVVITLTKKYFFVMLQYHVIIHQMKIDYSLCNLFIGITNIRLVSINPFLASVSILYPPQNTKKPKACWCFSGGIKWEHLPKMG